MRAGLRDGLGKGANERRMSANFSTLRSKLGVSSDGKGGAGSNIFRDVIASSRAQVNPDAAVVRNVKRLTAGTRTANTFNFFL